jgi:hypothetical protein
MNGRLLYDFVPTADVLNGQTFSCRVGDGSPTTGSPLMLNSARLS